MVSEHFKLQLANYRITTADIFYHNPDHLHLLQEFIWQDYDLAPDFPNLRKFLKFWQENLDGPLHSVRVCSAELIKPAEFRIYDHSLVLN